LREPLGGWNYLAAFLRLRTACRGGCGKIRMKRWHHPCKFVANKRKSQFEIHLADAILH